MNEMELPSTTEKILQRYHRRSRFSLQRILTWLIAIALVVGLWILPSERQRRACKRLAKSGGYWYLQKNTRPKQNEGKWWEHYILPVRSVSVSLHEKYKAGGLAAIEYLTGAEQVTFFGVRLDDSCIKPLSKFDNLTKVIFTGKEFDDQCLESMRSIPNLNNLVLFVTTDQKWDFAPIGKMENLQSLSLQLEAGAPKNFDKIADCKSLKLLSVRNTNPKDASPKALEWNRYIESLQSLPKLENLELDNAAITDSGLAQLAQIKALKSLGISEARITTAGLEPLSQLTELQNLDLSKTEIDDESLESLLKLTKLEVLDLSNTKITATGFARLRDLRELRLLTVSGLKIDQDSIRDLEKRLPGIEIKK